MKIDYGQLFVEHVVIHDVPLAPLAVVLSEGETDLDDPLRNYFAERLRGSLQKGFDVERDPESASTAPTVIGGILDGSVEFVAGSQLLASHLHSVQKPPVSPGLLVVAIVVMSGGRRGVALLKLERQKGMRAEQSANQGGQLAFAVDLIRSLIFTDTIRVFKAAVFATLEGSVKGKASDHQAGHEVAALAHFFLATFLGCRLAVAPETATRRWYELTEKYINDRVSDAVDKTNYELALLTELNSESIQIAPREFATAYLKRDDRQPYLRFLAEQGVSLDGIVKSLDLVRTAIRNVMYDFNSGVRVLASPEVVADPNLLTVEDAPDGRTRLSIIDALSRIRSGGR